MKKGFKKFTGLFITVCMLASMLTALPVSAATPVSQLSADFEGYADMTAFDADYNFNIGHKYNGEWQSVIELDDTTDYKDEVTKALHIHWNKPETITATESGNDALFGFRETDYSGTAVTSFDAKLDNKVSAFRAYNRLRVKKTDGTEVTSSINLVNGTPWSLTVLNTTVDANMEVGKWHHFTIVTSYDDASKTVTASLWMDGVKMVSNASNTYDGEVIIDATAGQNRLIFQGSFSGAATDELKPGIWVDNVMFSQLGDSYVSASVKSGKFLTDDTLTLTYDTALDEATVSPEDIKVTRNGGLIENAVASIYDNKVIVNIGQDNMVPNAEYKVILPEGTKDILGDTLSESARVFAVYSSANVNGTVKIASPASDSNVEAGKAVKIVANAPAGSEVSFYADSSLVASANADDSGVASVEWTPASYGKIYISAVTADDASDPVIINVLKGTNLNYSFAAGDATKATEDYEGVTGATKITGDDGKKGALNKFSANLTSGKHVLNLDIYVGEDGNGTHVTGTVSTPASSGIWNSFVSIAGGAVKKYNSTVIEGAAPVLNAWNNLRIVYDLDGSFKYDIYLNGEQIASDFTFTNSGATSLERFKVEDVVSASTRYYSNVTFSTLSEVEAADAVEITSLADGIVVEKGVGLVLRAAAADASSVEFYADGVKIGDGAAQNDGTFTYTWTPATDGAAKVYAVAAVDGVKYTSAEKSVTVTGDKTLSHAWRTFTAQDGSFSDSSDEAKDTQVAVVVTAAASGSQPYTQVQKSTVTEGYVSVECDVTFDTVKAGLSIYNRPGGSVSSNYSQHAVTFSNGTIKVYNGKTSVDTGVSYSANTPYHIRTLWNLAGRTIDIYVNGEKLAQQSTIHENWTNICYVRFAHSITGENLSYTIQNEKVTYYAEVPAQTVLPKFAGASVKDADGNTLNAFNLKAANVASIEAEFDSAIDAASLTSENFVLYCDGAVVSASLSQSEDGKTIIITPDTGVLTDASACRLEISADVASGSNEYTFSTISLGRAVKNAYFTKDSSALEEISGLIAGDKVTFSADVASDGSDDIWVVAAVYSVKDGVSALKDVSVTKKRISDISVSQVFTSELTLTAAVTENDILCGYVWTEEMMPYPGEAYTVPYQK